MSIYKDLYTKYLQQGKELICEYVSASTMDKVLEVSNRLRSGDNPVKGKWSFSKDGVVRIWPDASNIALGIVMTIEVIVENFAWLHKENGSYQYQYHYQYQISILVNLTQRLKVSI